MPRFRLIIEYDGGPFVGWQYQQNGPSVQQAVEEAVFRFCGERATVHGSGRTDTGVHALGQVAHVDLVRSFASGTVRDAINFHLKPAPIVVLDATQVADDFHARFSAAATPYTSIAFSTGPRRQPTSAVASGGCRFRSTRRGWRAAAAILVGRHDFTSFRSTMCQAETPVKTLDSLTVRRDGAEIRIEARARSFLHNQVRIIAGTLKLVGEGKWSQADVAEALDARDRVRAGPTAPPHGLCLVSVGY